MTRASCGRAGHSDARTARRLPRTAGGSDISSRLRRCSARPGPDRRPGAGRYDPAPAASGHGSFEAPPSSSWSPWQHQLNAHRHGGLDRSCGFVTGRRTSPKIVQASFAGTPSVVQLASLRLWRRAGLILSCRNERRANRADRFVAAGAGVRRRRLIGRRGWRRCRCGGGGALLLARGLGRQRLRHLLRPILGDDDVALLFGRGLVVDVLERVGPGLAGRLATAGRIEFLAVLECVRRRGVGLAVDRNRLVHVLAGIAIGEEAGVRGRTQALAGALVVDKTARHGGE